MTEGPSDFLPTKEVKLWHTNKSTKKSDNWKPRVPTFCTVIDPETNNDVESSC